jgi:hypothetical protein
MFCPSCAAPLDPAQRFCKTCGQAVPTATASIAARPNSVQQAAYLLFASVGASLLNLFYTWALIGRGRFPFVRTMLVTPVLLSIWIVLIVLALQRKNWARIVLTIGIASSALSALATLRFLSYPGIHYATFAVSWIVCLLRISAGYLLFTPASNAWFQARSTNSSAPR